MGSIAHLIVQCTFVLILTSINDPQLVHAHPDFEIYDIPGEYYTEKGLFYAAADGDIAYVKNALAAGINPDWHNNDVYVGTPLMIAAINGQVEVIKLLVDAGANLELTHKGVGPALFQAIVKNHPDAVRELVRAGADVNAYDIGDNPMTPLIHAVSNGFIGCVEALLEAPYIDVDLTDSRGFTALHYAAATRRDRSAIIVLLLKKGADRYKKSNDGQTPMDFVPRDSVLAGIFQTVF